jgi:hypothetical protein
VVSKLVTRAYGLVAPPRLREALQAATPPSGRARKG